MKKFALLLAALMLAAAFMSMPAFADEGKYVVEFFTNDEFVHLDWGWYREYKAGEEINHVPNVEVSISGHREYAMRLESTGEDIDPLGLTVNGDMRIEVYVVDRPEVVHAVSYSCSANHISMRDNIPRSSYSHTVGYEDGYVLTEDDLPIVYPYYDIDGRFYNIVWSKDPVGVAVTEDMEFTAELVEDENPETCTIEFVTNEPYLIFHKGFYDGTGSAFHRSEKHTVRVGKKTYFMPNTDLYLLGCEYAYRIQGTEEPVDFANGVMITEDTVFEAYIVDRPADEDIRTVTFRTDDYRGFVNPDWSSEDREISELSLYCRDGYVLSKKDLPRVPAYPGDGETYDFEWEPFDPIGHEVHEDMEFFGTTIVVARNYIVLFYDYDGEQVGWFYYTPEGTCIDPPKMDDKGDMVFIGWDNDGYLNVQDSMSIYAIRKPRGDMNLNDDLDAGDATIILRAVVADSLPEAEYFVRLADMNLNQGVDSGDASLVLRAIVG